MNAPFLRVEYERLRHHERVERERARLLRASLRTAVYAGVGGFGLGVLVGFLLAHL